jgi:hypothetical protein
MLKFKKALKIDKLPKNIGDILKIVEEIDKLDKCKNGLDWNKVIPKENIRTILFFAYINEYPISLFDMSFIERHKFLLSYDYDDEYRQCEGCWDCCGSLINIDYKKFYLEKYSDAENDMIKKKEEQKESKKINREKQKEKYGEDRYKAIMAMEKKITRYKKENKDFSKFSVELADLKDLNKEYIKEEITEEEKKEKIREGNRIRQQKLRDNKKTK